MQRAGKKKLCGDLIFGLTTLAVLAGSMVIVPAMSGQQDVDPTIFDSRPAANNAVQHALLPAANSKPKQQKSGSAPRHHPSNKAQAKKQSNHNQPLSTASLK